MKIQTVTDQVRDQFKKADMDGDTPSTRLLVFFRVARWPWRRPYSRNVAVENFFGRGKLVAVSDREVAVKWSKRIKCGRRKLPRK